MFERFGGELMFYDNQPYTLKERYKEMLTILGSLTLLFSESESPYLSYRAHENAFCRFFEAENLARLDCSADAKKGSLGIALKTWVGPNDQKIAEFGKLRKQMEGLSPKDLAKKVSIYRNERIRITKTMNGLDDMVYHIVRRIPGAMEILEYAFDTIDVDKIRMLSKKGSNNIYFTDEKHTYHYSLSKNTLYMVFDNPKVYDVFAVPIMSDPYSYLIAKSETSQIMEKQITSKQQICLRLYSGKADGSKFVAPKSGLNQWNAAGRPRHPNEVYIPYPAEDRRRSEGFFPGRDEIFKLKLPDGSIIDAKVCQQDCKAIMSNPNKILGEWLLRKVFGLSEWTVLTYDMLLEYGIDSVIFTKHGEGKYSIDFAEIGTYERFYKEKTESEE